MHRLSIDETRMLKEGHVRRHSHGIASSKQRSASQPQTGTIPDSTTGRILNEKSGDHAGNTIEPPAPVRHRSAPDTIPISTADEPLHSSDPVPEEPSSTSSSTVSYPDGPPDLEYTVATRRRIIFLTCFWTLVVLDSIGFPIGLYFGLTYGLEAKPNGEPRLTPNAVFSIVTAAIGGVSIIEYFLRSWRLWKKSSTARVIGADGRRYARWWFDWFHVVFTSTWLVLMVELIVGSTPKLPPIRLVAMPPASLLFCFGTDMAVREVFRYKGWRYPIRISSQPKGAVLLPAIYPFIEDIVAADGGGGTAYRERLAKRYHASHVFRSMLERMSMFWIVGSLAMATLTTILIFTLQADWGYAVGWSAPFLWAMVWTLCTWWYVEHMLKVERRTWNQEKPQA